MTPHKANPLLDAATVLVGWTNRSATRDTEKLFTSGEVVRLNTKLDAASRFSLLVSHPGHDILLDTADVDNADLPALCFAKAIVTPSTLQEQVRAHQGQVQTLLRSAIESSGDGLHTLSLLQWEGGGSATVLAADGRHGQRALTPGQQPLLGVEMAEALGHAALGLCASDKSGALPLAVRSPAGSNGVILVCPVGCSSAGRSQGLLLALYDHQQPEPPDGLHQRQEKQLQLISQRLGQLLEQR